MVSKEILLSLSFEGVGMKTRKDADFAFTWYSRSLVEIQSDARRIAELGFFGRTEKEFCLASINRNVESIRKFLLGELFRDVE